MKAETVVLAMLRASTQAQKIVADLLGSKLVPFEFNLSLYLAHPNAIQDLADHFRCRPETSFSKLAERIKQELCEKRPAVLFTKNHLQKLADNQQTIKRLARILQCEETQIYDALFDVPSIVQFIYSFDSQTVKKWLSLNLQNDVNMCPGYTVARYLATRSIPMVGDQEWGRLFDDKLWLRAPALTRLRGALIEAGYRDTTDSKVLATIINEFNNFSKTDAVHLDTLAILHIKRQVAWIVRQMTDHAVELLDEALQISQSASHFIELKNHVEFYERKHPALVWRSLLSYNSIENAESLQSLQAKFPNVVFTSTGAKEIPLVDVNLRTRQESVTTASWKLWKSTKTIVIVSCKVVGHADAVDILTCDNTTVQQIEPLMQLFSSIRFRTVKDGSSTDVGEYLLSQGKPLDRMRNVERLLSRFQAQIIRSLILAGRDIPNSVIPIWDKALNYEIPIQPPDNAGDSSFPVKRNEVLQDIKKNYQSQNLQVIDKLNT